MMQRWRDPVDHIESQRHRSMIETVQPQLAEDGYAIVRGVVGDDVLAPVRRRLDAVVNEQARVWLSESRITDLCEDAPFERRSGGLPRQYPAKFPNTGRRVGVGQGFSPCGSPRRCSTWHGQS